MPTIAFATGTNSRSRASFALRLRSPRDTPLPLLTNVLLFVLLWDTKPEAHQEDVPTPGTDTQNVFLCRVACFCRSAPPHGHGANAVSHNGAGRPGGAELAG